jgi:hypothetical protein
MTSNNALISMHIRNGSNKICTVSKGEYESDTLLLNYQGYLGFCKWNPTDWNYGQIREDINDVKQTYSV